MDITSISNDIVDRFSKFVQTTGGTIEIIQNNLHELDLAIEKTVYNDESILFAGVEDLPVEWFLMFEQRVIILN